MRALLSIDYTNDFVATDGKLTTGEAGQAIEQELVSVTKDYFDQGYVCGNVGLQSFV